MMSSGPTIALVWILNSIFTFVVVRRICRLHSGVNEDHFHDLFDPALSKRRAWSRQHGRGLNRTDKVLDSIRRPIGDDVRSYVRHFQLGLGIRVNVFILIPVLAATLWLMNFISS